MRPLMLDYRRSARPGRLGWLVLFAGMALAAAALMVFDDLKRDVTHWEERAAKTSRTVPRDQTLRDSEAGRRELKQANAVLLQLALPWENLFNALETTRGDKVALLSVEPEVGKAQVRIGAEAKTVADMLDYLRRLQGDAVLGEVVLLNHQIQTQDPEQALRFTVMAAWGKKP